MRLHLLLGIALTAATALAQEITHQHYDIGTPTLQELWVDPQNGDDGNNGSSRSAALRTVAEAWNRIPVSQSPATGYRVNLVAGEYPRDTLPHYWENRRGSYRNPIVFHSVDGIGLAVWRGDVNMFGSSYIYFLGLTIRPLPAGDAFHCEQCDHILLRSCELDGGSREAQETFKANQSSHIYLESNSIHGAYDNAVDFVGVQHGVLLRNVIYDAGDWCGYAKGGSAYIVVDGNEFHRCGTGGFTAGQGAGFEFMVSPWLHYEAYEVKIVNNVIHDTEGAGLGVNGGYNILVAHNTAYRIGSRSHALEIFHGLRSCDGDTLKCAQHLSAGGWGSAAPSEEEARIPNRNVYVYNNVFYNPPGFQTAYQHISVHGPVSARNGSNVPSPVAADDGLVIRGNVFWNGPADHPIGVEDGFQGCQSGACTVSQLAQDNSFNAVQPEFEDAAGGDYRPAAGSALFGVTTYPIPPFPGGDQPVAPAVPQGVLANTVGQDRGGTARAAVSIPGAYGVSGGDLLPPIVPAVPTPDTFVPALSNSRCAPASVKRGKQLRCRTEARAARGIGSVVVKVAGIGRATLAAAGGSATFTGTLKVGRKVRLRSYAATFTLTDSTGITVTVTGNRIRVR